MHLKQSSAFLSHKASAVNSLYFGNNRDGGFTSEFSNVWLTPHEFMFRDTSFASDVKKRDREVKSILYNLEKRKQKDMRLND